VINDSKVIYFEPFIAAEDFIFLTLLLLRMEEIIFVARTTTINTYAVFARELENKDEKSP
jgi:hypothetical protein